MYDVSLHFLTNVYVYLVTVNFSLLYISFVRKKNIFLNTLFNYIIYFRAYHLR